MINIVSYIATLKCNNNCIFCSRESYRQRNSEKTLEEIKIDLKQKIKISDYISLTGGEVAVRDDFIEILKYCKKIGFKNISLQTNGKNFSQKDLVKEVVNIAGKNLDVVVSFHTHRRELYKELSQNDGLKEVLAGMDNLIRAGVNVRSNTVVMKPNYKELSEIILFLSKQGITDNELMLVHPRGGALVNRRLIIPELKEIAPFVKEAIDKGKRRKQRITLESFPFCCMDDYCDHCIEKQFSADLMSRHKNLKSFTDFCPECSYFNVCPGIWTQYLELYNFNFKPFKDF
jgi:MoaA/NifB/PqqE/SkfB family radical SAM enzyme